MSQVDDLIDSYGDWRTGLLRELRQLINQTAPDLQEEFKWGVPVWTQNGLVCAISDFKDHIKMNFFKGAYLPDPSNLFNGGLDSKEHRSINFSKGSELDKSILQTLLNEAILYNEK